MSKGERERERERETYILGVRMGCSEFAVYTDMNNRARNMDVVLIGQICSTILRLVGGHCTLLLRPSKGDLSGHFSYTSEND